MIYVVQITEDGFPFLSTGEVTEEPPINLPVGGAWFKPTGHMSVWTGAKWIGDYPYKSVADNEVDARKFIKEFRARLGMFPKATTPPQPPASASPEHTPRPRLEASQPASDRSPNSSAP